MNTSGADSSGLLAASALYVAFPYGTSGTARAPPQTPPQPRREIAHQGALRGAHIHTHAGGTVGLLPVGKPGKYDASTRTVAAHGSGVTDLAFSPFRDDLLATASEESAVKLWTIPAEGKTLTEATAVLPGHPRRVEALRFHPTADNVRG